MDTPFDGARRWMPRTQLKLMALFVALVVIVVLLAGVLAERRLRERERGRVVDSLAVQARLVQQMLVDTPLTLGNREQIDAIADRAGRALGARVTILDAEGTVLGDSDVPFEKLQSVENHASRPEVVAARAGEVGTGSRLSRTVGRRLYYVTVSGTTPSQGIVRIARELPEVEAGMASFRKDLLWAGLLGVLAAIVLSFLATGIALRPLGEIRRVVSLIDKGDLGWRLQLAPGGEIAEIGNSINALAERLRRRLGEARQEKSRLVAVLRAMVEGVLVLDTHGRVILANPRFSELVDVGETALQGMHVLDLIRNAELGQLLDATATTREPVAGELALSRQGTTRRLHVQLVAFPNEGERVGTVAVFHDRTALHRLEQVRVDFVANASHELRTPLTALRGFAETLLHNEVDPVEQRRYLEIIDRHSKRLATLVDDLLELSSIESGRLELQMGRVDLAELGRTALADFEVRFAEKSLDVRLVEQGQPIAYANVQALEQIVSNLLDNAVKYTEAGGKIEVRVEDLERRGVVLRVIDTGVGIPRADLQRIFERFFRVDKARSRALGGTGLGLSIVKHLAQRMGGSVELQSEVGRGSTFSVFLQSWNSSQTLEDVHREQA